MNSIIYITCPSHITNLFKKAMKMISRTSKDRNSKALAMSLAFRVVAISLDVWGYGAPVFAAVAPAQYIKSPPAN